MKVGALNAGSKILCLVAIVLALAMPASSRADDRSALGTSAISHVPGSIAVFGGIGAGDLTLDTLLFHPWDLDSDQFGGAGFAGVAASRQLVRFWQYFWLEAEMGAGLRFEPVTAVSLLRNSR